MYELADNKQLRLEKEAQKLRPKKQLVLNPAGFLEWNDGEGIHIHNLVTNGSNNCKLTRMETDCLTSSGAMQGGFLLVDQALRPQKNDVVFVRYNGDLIIRRLVKRDDDWFLITDDPRHNEMPVKKGMQIERLGVVTWAINKIS